MDRNRQDKISPFSNGITNMQKRIHEIGVQFEIKNKQWHQCLHKSSDRSITFVLLNTIHGKLYFRNIMNISIAIVEDLDEVRQGFNDFISLSQSFILLVFTKQPKEPSGTAVN